MGKGRERGASEFVNFIWEKIFCIKIDLIIKVIIIKKLYKIERFKYSFFNLDLMTEKKLGLYLLNTGSRKGGTFEFIN